MILLEGAMVTAIRIRHICGVRTYVCLILIKHSGKASTRWRSLLWNRYSLTEPIYPIYFINIIFILTNME
jgi:hypothetical protein